MASELQVQTISGPPTGVNANKILIPSGQTLSVVDGLSSDAMPAGSVIQVVHGKGSDTFTSSGSAWVTTPVAFSITPKYSNSKIIGIAQVNVWRSSTAAYFGVRVVNSGGNTLTPATYGDGYFNASGGMSWDTTYQFSYIAGSTNTITSTFQLHPNGGGSWFPNNAPTFSPDSRWSFSLWEIAA